MIQQINLLRQQNSLLELVLAALVSGVAGVLFLITPWLSLVFVLGVALVILLLLKPRLIPYLVIAATVLASGMQRGRLIPMLIPNEVILVLMVGMALPIVLIPKWDRTTIVQPVFRAILILIAGTVIIPEIAYMLRGIPLGISDQLALLAPLQYILVFWLFRYLVTDETQRYKLISWMLLGGAVVGLIAVLQAFRIGPVMWLLRNFYSSRHFAAAGAGRATSLLGAWNALGVFMTVNLLIARAYLYNEHPEAPKKSFIISTMGICAAGLLVSGSYAGLGSTLAGLLLIGHLEKRLTRNIVLLIGLGFLMIPLFPFLIARFEYQYGAGGWLPETFVFRLRVWREVFWPLIREHWLFGYKPAWSPHAAWGWAESEYINRILQGGVASVVSLLVWVGLLMKWLRSQTQATNQFQSSASIALFVILLLMALMGVTNAVFTFSGVIEYIWIFIGIIAGIYGGQHVTRPA